MCRVKWGQSGPHTPFSNWTGPIVKRLKLPAWKVGDRGFEHRSGIQVSNKHMFFLHLLVKIKDCWESLRDREVACSASEYRLFLYSLLYLYHLFLYSLLYLYHLFLYYLLYFHQLFFYSVLYFYQLFSQQTRHVDPNAGLMLAHRRRRWANIRPAFGQ